MTTVFHVWPYGRFIEIQSNLRRKKLHRTNQGSNFLGGSFSNRDNVRAPIPFRRESLVGEGILVGIRMFLVQTPPCAWPGLATQPHYEAPGDFWVKNVKMQRLTWGEWGCPLDNGPKLAVGQPNSSSKKIKKSQPQHLKRWFFLKNEPIHFHINSTSVIRLVK